MVSTRQRTGARSLYSRMMRLITPILMAVFLLLGLGLLLVIRSSAQTTVTQSHRTEMVQITSQISNELDKIASDLSELAGERDARDFARDTLVNISGTTIDETQTRLLGDFANLLEQNPDYLAIRYVTFNGSVWSEAVNSDTGIPTANAGIRLGAFAADPSLESALAAAPGEVVVSGILFEPAPGALPNAADLIPFLRLSTPIAPDSSFATNIAGVMQLDVAAEPLLATIRAAVDAQIARQNGRRIVVADQAGNVLYNSGTPNADMFAALRANQPTALASVVPVDSALLQPDMEAQVSGADVISTARLSFGGSSRAYWTVTLIDNTTLLENQNNLLAVGVVGGSIALGALLSLVVGAILRRTMHPVSTMQTVVEQWVADETPVPPDAEPIITPDDEVGQLMSAFQSVTMRVKGLKDELEAQQERYTRNMDIAARIGRETATLYDIDELLNRAIDLICQEFGFYHAQVFLLDDIGEHAILMYSHGEIGRQLLASQHKIRVGSNSVIGTVTKTGSPLVVNDTTTGTLPHQVNPLLADTRAEMALPLQFGDTVLGALDVQSRQPNSFQPDELRTFQILADQIAVALQNVRLLIQSEERVSQIDALNRQLTQTAWKETSQRSGLASIYRYDLVKFDHEAPTEAPALSLPIAIRGEVIGSIDAAAPEGAFFTEGDHAIMRAVADRVAIAIENARLFEETQSGLAETFSLYQLSRSLNEANNLEDILQAIITSTIPDAVGGQIGVFDRYTGTPEYVEIVVDNAPPNAGESMIGRRLKLADYPILAGLQANQVALVGDTRRDARISGDLRRLLRNAESAIVIPFSVRGAWHGVIAIEFAKARAFTESEERLYAALIDQAGVAIDNRLLLQQNEQALIDNQRLFRVAESERARLSSILNTLPAGVLVLDPRTFKPLQYNHQIELLFGRAIDPNAPFTVETYNIYRSGTSSYYPADSLPVFVVSAETGLIASDDISIPIDDETELNLLMNAVPIVDENGEMSAIVAAFQDITPLRSLERTLEVNLRETVALYETTRALSEAEDIDEVLDQVIYQLSTQGATDAYILLVDERSSTTQIARSLNDQDGVWTLPTSILSAREMLLMPNLRDEFELDDAARLALINGGIEAVASIPMRARSRREAPLGWLVLTFAEPQDFTPEREQFLTTLNENTAVALENRYLFESTEQALQETASLYGVTTNLSRARTADEIGAAIYAALETLAPDMYSAYLSMDGRLMELFNLSLDTSPLDLSGMIERHHLLTADNLFVDDLRAIDEPTPFERELLELGNVRGFALVHMRAQSQPVGCFMIAFHRPHSFGGGDARYLGTVADSASVVIDNYVLLAQIQGSLQETSVLYQASRALNDASTPEEILNVVISHLTHRHITQAFMALLTNTTWEGSSAMAQVVTSWQSSSSMGIDLTGINLTAEQYPAWRLLTSPGVLMIDDVSTAESLDMMERIGVESLELNSLTIMPLRVGGRPIGVIVIGSKNPYTHTERDQRIFQSLSEQISLRMEAARLLEQTERRARQLATSAEVSQIASSILDLNVLLPRIVNLIAANFGYDHAQIFLMDDVDDYAVLRASTGEAGQKLLSINHKLQKGSQSVIGQVTALGEPTIASDTADARVVHRPNPYLPNTRSEMAIPLTLKGKVIGALDVQSNQPNAFADDDIAVLTTLAAQVSVAIDNARLFEQSSSRASEMTFLFNVTTAAAAADNLQQALANVAAELYLSLDALSASIYLPQIFVDAEERELIILQPVALAGTDQPLSELSEVRLDSDENLIAYSAINRRPLIIGDLNSEPRYLSVVAGARSAIIVPLVSGVQLVGLVALESEMLNAFDQDTLQILLTLSGTLSAVIQNQQLLEQMQETNEQLRELDRLKSDFLANMSHELRTPLNSIIGFSRVILKGIDGPLTEMQEQDLSTIYNSGLHLLNLINDILDQAKIAAGKMDLQFDYFEMKAVVDGVRSIGIGLVKDKPIDIFVDVAPGLPRVYGDEFRTRQVLINLVSNAAKFTRDGTITITTYPVLDDESGRMMVRTDVTDTGIGIADNDLPLLFEAFRQVDSSLTRTQGGTGLGLPISKSLVEMQGGRMLVTSRVNVGSTFSVLMPVEPVVEQEEKPKKKTTDSLGQTTRPKNVTGMLKPLTPDGSSEPQPDTSGGYTHVKRQILLIEDNPDMVDQYRRALQREGFDIFTASIPLEAEAMASGLHPTIIVMDVNFANGTGWDILGKLKARDDTFDIPVIVVTLSNERDRACDMGAFRFIQRPFTPEELVGAVQEAEAESRIDRILIIDDQPESVRLLTNLLDEQGQFRVFSAANGAEGIALVARRRPNLVILDLRMPEMDGFQVAQELRNNPETATIPILVVTGDSLTPEEREQLLNMAVLYKTDISAEAYQQFIEGVRGYLNGE